MLSTAAFIIGMIILGLCIVVAALVLSGAINGAASALKESTPQSMQQPTLTFLTEYDAADYLGISLNELDYIRSEGLLEGAFIAVTSLEQTGEENYVDYEDGVEVSKTRPVMSNVTRFLFNRQLLDEKMMEAIRDGKHINPFRSKAQDKKQGGKKNKSGSEGKKNKPAVVDLFAEDTREEKNDNDKGAPAENKEVEAAAEKAEKPEKLSIEYVEQDSDSDAEKPAETPEKKPAAAGPQMPMGPIGDDEDEDDVIDIMERINKAKNQNERPNANRPNGNRPNGGGRPNGNRSNGNRPNGGRPNGNRPNGGHN